MPAHLVRYVVTPAASNTRHQTSPSKILPSAVNGQLHSTVFPGEPGLRRTVIPNHCHFIVRLRQQHARSHRATFAIVSVSGPSVNHQELDGVGVGLAFHDGIDNYRDRQAAAWCKNKRYNRLARSYKYSIHTYYRSPIFYCNISFLVQLTNCGQNGYTQPFRVLHPYRQHSRVSCMRHNHMQIQY
jgi:hypothetical protein